MRTSSTSEQSNLTQTQVGLRQMLEGKDLLAAPAKSQDRSHAAPAPKVAESQIKGMVNQVMQLRCYLKAKLKPMRRLKPSQRRQPGASLRIPRVTRARSTFVASSISLIGCRNGGKCPFSHSNKTPERTPTPGDQEHQVFLVEPQIGRVILSRIRDKT